MWEYVRMIVMFPAMVYFIKYIDSIKLNKECIVKSLIYLCIILLLRRADVYLAVFLVGILCARYELLEKFNNLFINKDKLSIAISLIMGLTIIFYRAYHGSTNSDMFFAPIIVYVIINLKNRLKLNKFEMIMSKIGKYSIYMWLTHTFIAYYYYQSYILYFTYSILIFLAVTILSLLIAIVLNYIYSYINSRFKLKFELSDKLIKVISIFILIVIWGDFIRLLLKKFI